MNKLKYLLWLHVLPLRWLLWLRDKKFNTLSKRDKLIRKIFLPFQFRPGYDFYKFEMTEELANFIKDLRVRDPFGYSWRAVAREVHDKYPELGVIRGNQLEGQDLCRYAAAYFGETDEDGWN